MDPELRTWWRALDDLPNTLGTIHVWRDIQAGIPRGAGHMHPNPTTMFCLLGVIRVHYCGITRVDLRPGDGVVIASGVWHHCEQQRPGSICFGQGFLSKCSDVVLTSHQRAWGGQVPNEPSRRMIEAVLNATNGTERQSRMRDLLAEVLSSTVDHLDLSLPPLRAMIDLLWSHFQRITVDELLAASGLSRSRAYAVFTAGYGVPPKEAIHTMRLWLAGNLLATGSSVSDTAARCGFAHADTFSRAWKRHAGRAPSVTV